MIGKLFFPRRRVIDLPPAQHAVPPAVPEGELPVLNLDMLIERTGTKSLVDVLRTKLGFPPEVFDATVRPVIAGFAEFVQLLPASESHHHAQLGGLFTHAVEVVNLALDLRRGQILPRGAPPEAIGEQVHRWTYAVFVAALLHGVGKPIADLRVVMRKGPAACEPWSPLAGSMFARGATSYRVEFTEPTSRHDELHWTLPVVALAVATREDKLLLVHRLNPPLADYWAPCAGYVEIDESLEEGARREVKEETGCDVVIDKLLNVYSRAHMGVMLVTFAARVVGGDLAPQAQEVAAARFFARDELPDQPPPVDGKPLDYWFYEAVKEIFENFKRGTGR